MRRRFPGPFPGEISSEDEEIVIDPFNGGEIKSHEESGGLLDAQYGGKFALQPEFLEPTKKQILKRMLGNLKAIYLRDELVKSLPVLDRLIILDPAAEEDVRERGAVYLRLECLSRRRTILKLICVWRRMRDDAESIREQMVELAKQVR